VRLDWGKATNLNAAKEATRRLAANGAVRVEFHCGDASMKRKITPKNREPGNAGQVEQREVRNARNGRDDDRCDFG
jgi:hypothetical protein